MGYNYIPKYIRQSETKRPKDVITAARWNELFNLLIEQGDYTAEELGKILDYLSTGLEDLSTGLEDLASDTEAHIADGTIHSEKVTITYANGAYTADKTYAQIIEAVNAGKFVYAEFNGVYYYYDIATSPFATFNRTFIDTNKVKTTSFDVYNDHVSREDITYESVMFIDISQNGDTYEARVGSESVTYSDIDREVNSRNRTAVVRFDGIYYPLVEIASGLAVFAITSLAVGHPVIMRDMFAIGSTRVQRFNEERNIGTSQELEDTVNAIEEKIPSQASAQNQLADKAFVNSTVGTNTAYYISNAGQPFTSLAQLQAYSGTVTNNDYAFVVGTDSAGNTTYTRYKYNATTHTWAAEYVLNNSSFTAAQWAAIESGITAALVASYTAHIVNSGIHVTAAQKNAWNGKYTKPANGIPASDLADGVVGDGYISFKVNGVNYGGFRANSKTDEIIEFDVEGTAFVGYVLKTGDTYELYETTIEALRQAIEYNSGGAVVRVIDDVAYVDDFVEYQYAGYTTNPGLFIFSNVSENISLMYIHHTNGGIMVNTLYNPTTKTDAMTQAVGRDANGLLWTAPTGGGGSSFDIHNLQSENNIISDDELAFYDVSANNHRKISYGWLCSDIKTLLDNYYVKSVNGLRDVVTLKAENIKTNTSGIVAEYKFGIEGEFDSGLIGVLNNDGTQATAAQVIAALNSGKGVQFGVYDQTHSIEYTTASNFRYLIEGESVNIVFTVARGHYYTPANILVSWNGHGWDETEYDRDHAFPTYTHVPDGSYVWNTQELLDRLDSRVDELKSDLEDKQDKALVVNIERIGGAGGGTYTADKTNAEIYAAWQAGREVIASINGGKMPCLQADATSAYFNLLIGGDGVSYGLVSIITTDELQTVTVSMTALQPTTISDTAGYFTTDTVEGALAEIGAELSGINTLIGSGVIE